jgi:hypothetical protein
MDQLAASINFALDASATTGIGPRVDAQSTLDFQPYNKTSERVNTYPISDWSAVNKQRRLPQSGIAGGFAFKEDDATSAFNSDKAGSKARSFLRPGAQRVQPGGHRQVGKKPLGGAPRTNTVNANQNGQRRQNNQNNRPGFQYQNQRGNNQNQNNRPREQTRAYSCAIPSNWENIARYPLKTPQGTTIPSIKTVLQVGTVDTLHPDYKTISPKLPKSLQIPTDPYDNSEVPLDQDPNIHALLKNEDDRGDEATFVMTATVAALLMCSHHTIQPWDLQVDVRENGITYITTGPNANSIINKHLVDETVIDRLPQEADNINSVTSLAQEATIAQQNLRQMVISRGLEPNTFAQSAPAINPNPAVTAYNYRRFYIDDVAVIVRAPLFAHTPGKPNETIYIGTCFEFDSSFGGYHVDYRKNLDTLFASVFSNELKTNVAYMHRVLCESIVSGNEDIRFYWLSRSNTASTQRHEVVSTTSFSFTNLIALLQARRADYFDGLAYNLSELILDQGLYTLLREPNERSLSLYQQHPVTEESAPQ